MRRWIVRLLVLLLVVLLAGPYLIPMPAVGVEAAALADADGYFIDVDGLSTYVLERGDAD
ncbi:MAG: hypothetical protein JNJ78_25400, partial [Anaerolineae bacterium]|nr:hypothetical protein [Anaerolineae bacterium]